MCTASKDTAPRLAINDKPCKVQEWACLSWGMLLENPHVASSSQKWRSLRGRADTPSEQASSPFWKCLSFKGFVITQKHRKEIREKETVSLLRFNWLPGTEIRMAWVRAGCGQLWWAGCVGARTTASCSCQPCSGSQTRQGFPKQARGREVGEPLGWWSGEIHSS